MKGSNLGQRVTVRVRRSRIDSDSENDVCEIIRVRVYVSVGIISQWKRGSYHASAHK